MGAVCCVRSSRRVGAVPEPSGGALKVTTTTLGKDDSGQGRGSRQGGVHSELDASAAQGRRHAIRGRPEAHASPTTRDWSSTHGHAEDAHRQGEQGVRRRRGPGAANRKRSGKSQSRQSEQFSREDTAKFQAFAARANLLAFGQGDLMYRAEELTRQIVHPHPAVLGQDGESGYLKSRPKLVTWYNV